jgi:hypothetical protein
MNKILIGLFIGLLLVGTVSATNWYVDNAVASSGNGQSWSTAWKAFSNIVWSSVQPGDTIYISGGAVGQTYYETLTPQNSGTLGNYITITKGIDAEHNGIVIIDGNNNSLVNGIYIKGVSHVYLKGFEIRQTTSGVKITCDGGKVDDIIVDSMYIHDYYDQAGFVVNGYCGAAPSMLTLQHITIKNSLINATFEDISGQTDNIYLQYATNILIENNTLIQNNKNIGGSVDNIQFGNNIGNATIRSNFMINHGTHGDQCMILGVNGAENYLDVYNNIAVHTGQGTVFLLRTYSGTTNPTSNIYHNTFIADPQTATWLHVVGLQKPAEMDNNLLLHFGVSGSNGNVVGAPAEGLSVTKLKNNLYYNNQYFSGLWFGNNGQNASSFNWNTWLSMGGNGHISNPSFVDYSVMDFRPVSTLANGSANPICTGSSTGGYIGALLCIDSVTYHPADTNQNGCIDLGEISVYVSLWLNGSGVTLSQVSDGVNEWMKGC